MSMQAESLEVLESAALPPAQARAIVRAIEIAIAGAKDVLATKHDIVLLRAEMVEMCANMRSELKTEIGELRAEFHAGISSITRQMYTAMLGQMAVLLGLAYFFVTRLAA